MNLISFLFLDIIHSILSKERKKEKKQSKFNFHLNIFSQLSNNRQVSSIIRNLYRVRQATWLVVNADQQQKASEDAPYAGTSGNNRVVTRSSSPISRLFFCLIPPPVSPPFTNLLPPASGFFLGFLLVCSPPKSTYPREQLTRNILAPSFSSFLPLFVLELNEENYCFSRILLF